MTGTYGPAEVQELGKICNKCHTVGKKATDSWKTSLFIAWAFKDNFQVIDNKTEVVFESAYECLFMDAVHSPQICRESNLYICK